jgi:chromosome segregation ATPase
MTNDQRVESVVAGLGHIRNSLIVGHYRVDDAIALLHTQQAEIERLNAAKAEYARQNWECTRSILALRTRAEQAEAEVERMRAERGEFSERYWECRYRDEAAENEAMRAAMVEAVRIGQQSGAFASWVVKPLAPFTQPEPKEPSR